MQNSQDSGADGQSTRRGGLQRPVRLVGRLALLICVIVAGAFAIDSFRMMLSTNAEKERIDAQTVRVMGLVEPVHKKLADRFTDSQGRLLADPPATADQLLDPKTIVLGHLDSTDAETPSIAWDQLEAHLAEVTGRKVVDLVFDDGPEQLAQIDKGQITIVAVHAADAPFLVNNYGYQPMAVLGTDGGANGNHLDIIVSTASPIAQPADLRGHSLVCTVPSSVTGYRAAVTLLMGDLGLRPNVDYTITWSLKQKASILGVASKQYEAAAISDDKLQSLLADGTVSPSSYKTIYSSGVIPRTTIGWFYNLQPALADKIRQGILSFEPKAGAEAQNGDEAKAETTASPLHFIPIDYKKDFELVREIDDRFDPRLDTKLKRPAAATEPSVQAQ